MPMSLYQVYPHIILPEFLEVTVTISEGEAQACARIFPRGRVLVLQAFLQKTRCKRWFWVVNLWWNAGE
jgi:hypothetical protein